MKSMRMIDHPQPAVNLTRWIYQTQRVKSRTLTNYIPRSKVAAAQALFVFL
jgi:hypothetical protein